VGVVGFDCTASLGFGYIWLLSYMESDDVLPWQFSKCGTAHISARGYCLPLVACFRVIAWLSFS
jgi:hypothetical protein